MSEIEINPPVPAVPVSHVSTWRNFLLFLVLLAMGLAFWQWYETRSRLAKTEQEVAQRLKAAEDIATTTNLQSLRIQEQTQTLVARFNILETKIAEFQGQTTALQTLYQELAKSRDDASLLEIEQAVNLAAQQLQLAGNVQVAVVALQTADAKLSVLNRPQFIPLRKALGRDLDRLHALPMADKPGISLKLENIVAVVDELPLLMDVRPRPLEKASPDTAASWWVRTSQEVWREIKGLVRIQRFDRTEQVLLAPGQEFFLRGNLKLRLLNARLALLSHDQWLFRKDLKMTQEWLNRHFDVRDKRVQAAQATLKQLAGAEINIELPNLNDSLAGLRVLKNQKEKK